MSKMTAKGQVTVPKQLRDHLGLKPGSEVSFELAQDGRVFLKAQGGRRKGVFTRLRGSAKLAMTTEEIMALSRGENGA
jgi:AbrB family looped-hinge helix DNA binding protein